jgi:hypothetical protein
VRFARAGRPSRPLYITMRDGGLDRLRDGKRSISFIQRKANNREN